MLQLAADALSGGTPEYLEREAMRPGSATMLGVLLSRLGGRIRSCQLLVSLVVTKYMAVLVHHYTKGKPTVSAYPSEPIVTFGAV